MRPRRPSASGPLAFSSASCPVFLPPTSSLALTALSPPVSHGEPAGADVMSAFAPESAGAVADAGPPVADPASLGGKVHISFCQS